MFENYLQVRKSFKNNMNRLSLNNPVSTVGSVGTDESFMFILNYKNFLNHCTADRLEKIKVIQGNLENIFISDENEAETCHKPFPKGID